MQRDNINVLDDVVASILAEDPKVNGVNLDIVVDDPVARQANP